MLASSINTRGDASVVTTTFSFLFSLHFVSRGPFVGHSTQPESSICTFIPSILETSHLAQACSALVVIFFSSSSLSRLPLVFFCFVFFCFVFAHLVLCTHTIALSPSSYFRSPFISHSHHTASLHRSRQGTLQACSLGFSSHLLNECDFIVIVSSLVILGIGLMILLNWDVGQGKRPLPIEESHEEGVVDATCVERHQRWIAEADKLRSQLAIGLALGR